VGNAFIAVRKVSQDPASSRIGQCGKRSIQNP